MLPSSGFRYVSDPLDPRALRHLEQSSPAQAGAQVLPPFQLIPVSRRAYSVLAHIALSL